MNKRSPDLKQLPFQTMHVVRPFCFLVSFFVMVVSCGRSQGVGGEEIAPLNAPFPMPQLARPVFPSNAVDIRDFGAREGGEFANTAAIAQAIDSCAKAGGGRVVVPAGRWLTGPIHLRSHINLYLSEGAVVVFSDNPADYLPPVLVRVGGVELYNYSPFIYANSCENVAITGPGRLDGNADAWRPWKLKETKEIFRLAPNGVPVEQRVFGTPEAAIRPNFVVFMNCRNVLWEGFTIGGGANWTLNPVYCENVIIRRVNVLTDGPNNDGIDPDSCRNVLIEHCVFDTGDDCVVLKSGYNEDGWRVAKPMENLVMRWCLSRRGHGGLVIGSEMSGDVRNVYMHDCEFEGTDRAVRIKSRRGRGGVVENVWVERIRAKNLLQEVVIMNMDYSADRNSASNERAPVFRKIHFKDIKAEGAPVAVRLTGLADAPISDISFESLEISSTRGVVACDVRGLTFAQTQIRVTEGPVYSFTNASEVLLPSSDVGGRVFVEVEGSGSHGIVIQADIDSPSPVLRLGEGVLADAVRVLAPAEVR